MKKSVIDLRIFLANYRQALLFGMIEGLCDGEGFQFIDTRSPEVIEDELQSAGLTEYAWKRVPNPDTQASTFEVVKRPQVNRLGDIISEISGSV